MVKLMLDGLGGDARLAPAAAARPIACYHVNSRVSAKIEDIGTKSPGKVLALVGYCLQAVWLRFRHGARTLYYVPAPGKRSALYRDWIVMALCRPFFKNVVFHWHAIGLGEWLETRGTWLERQITRLLLGRPALSIPLAQAGADSARWLKSRRIEIIPNGIPDPCPGFETTLRPRRAARLEQRRAQTGESGPPPPLRLLFISLCTREKGLFDTLEGVALFNRRHGEAQRIHLTVAGNFVDPGEEREFRERIASPGLAGCVEPVGFTSGEAKKRLFEESDGLCFPSYYSAESFGLVVVEAMAFGLPVVASRWKAIPEILPPDYPGLVDPQAPGQIADALEWLAGADCGQALRERFLARFSLERHLNRLAEAIQSVEG